MSKIISRKKLFQDPITREDVEVVAKKAFGVTAKVFSYHVRIFSEEKLGFMGAHRHLAVTVENPGSTDKEIHSFFLKTVPYDIEEQASVIEESNAFFKETYFYKNIVSQLLKSIKDKSWIAQCYLVKDDTLVFEDLKLRDFVLKDKLLDVITLKSALAGLAKFHASTRLAEKRLGKTFAELHPKALQECLFTRKGRFHNWYNTGVDAIVAIAKQLKLDHTNIPKICDRIHELIQASRTRRNVLCHGDVKSLNLLFDESRPVPKCVLVDFQLLRYCPAMTDVAQLLYLNARRQLRDEYEEELLRYYHEILCETLRDNDPAINLPSFKEILREFEDMRLVGLVTTALYSPINLIEGRTCAELTKDSDGFARLLFKDRVDLVLSIMKQDQAYNEVLTEIVTELVQRSKQWINSC